MHMKGGFYWIMSFEKIIDVPRLNRFKTKILNLVYKKDEVYNKNEIDNKFSQNAFSKVTVGSTTVAADSKADTLTLVAGSNITITPDATNDKITIAAKDTTYSSMTGATSSAAGTSGLVPAPAAGDQDKFLKADGTWQEAGGSNKDCLPLSGGVVTGNVQQSGGTTDYDTYKFRNISLGTSSTPPTDANFGGNGSIYFYYS